MRKKVKERNSPSENLKMGEWSLKSKVTRRRIMKRNLAYPSRRMRRNTGVTELEAPAQLASPSDNFREENMGDCRMGVLARAKSRRGGMRLVLP
jgi:hypothetical protein